jgi:NAD(P)H-dependent FMN reductase
MTGGPRGVGAVVVRVLLVCGSLQRRSANRAALDVVRVIVVGHDATVEEFDALADIPAFDSPAGQAHHRHH